MIVVKFQYTQKSPSGGVPWVDETIKLFDDNILAINKISHGTFSAANIDKRFVLETAFRNKARSVVLVHNHVNGIPVPSRDDLNTTKAVGDFFQGEVEMIHVRGVGLDEGPLAGVELADALRDHIDQQRDVGHPFLRSFQICRVHVAPPKKNRGLIKAAHYRAAEGGSQWRNGGSGRLASAGERGV